MSIAPPGGRSSLNSHVIRVGAAAAVIPLLREHGVDADACAAEAGLTAQVFADPDNVVPFTALCRLVQRASERTGLSDLGLRACVNTGLSSLGVLGYLVANSDSVERALAALQEFLHVHDQGATPFFAREGASAVLGYEVVAADVPGADHVTFGAITVGANVLRSLCGPEFRLQEVTFAYRPPADAALFRSFFRAPVRFDAERSALVFEARWLAVPVTGADPFIRDMLLQRIRQQLSAAPEATEDRLRRVVRSLVAGGRFSADDLAAAFALSPRTLARRLSEHGTSFRDLVDDARFQAARNLLQCSDAPVAEIAARLGYSDTPAFTRAFRRWAGASPADWRRTHRAM